MSYLDYAGLTRFKNKSLEDFASKFSNPNLFINSNFAVNQRGLSSYSGQSIYTVDRWRLYQASGACVVTPRSNGGISVNNSAGTTFSTFRQYYEDYEKLAGKTVTVSCHINSVSGAVRIFFAGAKSETQYSADLTVGQNSLTITCDSTTTQMQIGFNLPAGASIDVSYMKLEIGSVATAYTPPIIAEELPKCKRYFQKIQSIGTGNSIGLGFLRSSTQARTQIPLSTPMRTTPTITAYTIQIFNANTNATISYDSGTTLFSTNDNFVFVQMAHSTSLGTMGDIIFANGQTANSYLTLDAEIY